MQTDILIVGGGTGGVAAALAAAETGVRVILTEETWVLGGQFTAQAVPPDEHPWIEQFGCTARYRQLRNLVRRYYRENSPLIPALAEDPFFNPGGGWVSRLCASPQVFEQVIETMLLPLVQADRLTILRRHKPFQALVDGDEIHGIALRNLETGDRVDIEARFILDATELGDLLPITGTEYRLGAESKSEFGEENAVNGPAEPDNVQGLTWVFPLAWEEGADHRGPVPAGYDKWKAWKPDFWPGPLLGFEVLHAHTGEPRTLPLFGNSGYELFSYRQIVRPESFSPGYVQHPITMVNWPQNDYFEASILDVEEDPQWDLDFPGANGPISRARLEESKTLGRCLVHWLQAEAPRHDGGTGYPECSLHSAFLGTADGFTAYPYIRESRRINARFTLTENHVSAQANPGCRIAPELPKPVGIGAYRIDLHPSTNGKNTIDTASLCFQIPLGTLIPERVKNLIPACKNLGVTHISNGCTRLHPVEWNIGEAAGALAAFCVQRGCLPGTVYESDILTEEFQKLLIRVGVELHWPVLQAL